MQNSNNNQPIIGSMTIQNDQIVKKDDMWPESQPQSEKSYDFSINKKHSTSKIQQRHQETIQVKIEPQENIIYQFYSSKEPNDEQENANHYPKKTKKISKEHQQKETIDNSLYSNSNRKLVTIILKFLESLPDCTDFKQKYLNPYEINGDRQNIVILPFLVLDFFLEEILKVYDQEIRQQKIIIFNPRLKYKINLLFTVLRGIFTQFKLGLQKANEKKTQKKPNSEANEKLVGIFIDMAQYFNNTIPELFLEFVSKKFQIRREDLNFLFKWSVLAAQRPSIKIEEQPTMKFYRSDEGKETFNQSKTINPMTIVEKCKKYIQTSFPLKERQISYAYDRFFSVRLGLIHLRKIFEFPHDYMLDIKKILFRSKAEGHKRQSGRGKRAFPNQMERIYNQLKLPNQGQNKKIDGLGTQFLMALMVISLTKEKQIEVLQNFINSINRKIQYLSDLNDIQLNANHQSNDLRFLKYTKSHYNYFINMISRELKDQSIQTNAQTDKKNSKSTKIKLGLCLRISLSDWIYPSFFQLKQSNCKIQEKQVKIENQVLFNSLKEIKSAYIKAQSQFEGQIQQDGITLVFYE